VAPDPENLRAEYAATNDAYMHYDAFRWQAGSFLIAGVFIFWGLLIQNPLPTAAIFWASILVTALMSIWLLFAHHYRQIYLFKLRRIWELESQLGGMQQHSRFRPNEIGEVLYKPIGPKGHHLDMATYFVTSSGSIVLGLARNGFDPTLLLPIVPMVGVLVYIWRKERAFQKLLDGLGPIAAV
jgi:hypothetical protein